MHTQVGVLAVGLWLLATLCAQISLGLLGHCLAFGAYQR